MTFHEILNLYKSGKLEDEQKNLVKEEIEKHEAISDYLFETSEIPQLEDIAKEKNLLDCTNDEQEIKFVNLIRSSIRKTFIKTGVITACIALIMTLIVVFALPSMISLFYYNPNEIVGVDEYGFETTRMQLDMSVYTELFMPEVYRNEVRADAEGYGVYNIVIPQRYAYEGNKMSVGGRIVRNELILYQPDLFDFPAINAFVWPEDVYWPFREMNVYESPEESYNALEELNDGEYYSAYISFWEFTNYEDFYKWYKEKDLPCHNLWCSVNLGWTGWKDDTWIGLIGFNPEIGGLCLNWDRDTYPMLCTVDYGTEQYPSADSSDEEDMKTHFISMLRYINDNPDVMRMFGANESNRNLYWNDAISYIEQNGLKLNGFVVTAKKEDIIKFAQDDRVSYVWTTEK